jgi:hypothetical protein
MISDGVGLVLALRESEQTLEDMSRGLRDITFTHNIQYILQKAKVDETKKALDAVVASLSALPHTPVQIVASDLGPLRAWMDAHREQFNAFKTFCDEYRPPSPMEDGEVHTKVDHLLSVVRDLGDRVDSLAIALERRIESLEPGWVSDVGIALVWFGIHTKLSSFDDALSYCTRRTGRIQRGSRG